MLNEVSRPQQDEGVIMQMTRDGNRVNWELTISDALVLQQNLAGSIIMELAGASQSTNYDTSLINNEDIAGASGLLRIQVSNAELGSLLTFGSQRAVLELTVSEALHIQENIARIVRQMLDSPYTPSPTGFFPRAMPIIANGRTMPGVLNIFISKQGE